MVHEGHGVRTVQTSTSKVFRPQERVHTCSIRVLLFGVFSLPSMIIAHGLGVFSFLSISIVSARIVSLFRRRCSSRRLPFGLLGHTTHRLSDLYCIDMEDHWMMVIEAVEASSLSRFNRKTAARRSHNKIKAISQSSRCRIYVGDVDHLICW